jgi:hypothetical protein
MLGGINSSLDADNKRLQDDLKTALNAGETTDYLPLVIIESIVLVLLAAGAVVIIIKRKKKA